MAKEARWMPKVERIRDLAYIVDDRYGLAWGLDVLASAIVSAENLIARSKFLVEELRTTAKSWMLEEGIETSHRKGARSMLRLDPVLKFAQNREGKRQKRAIAKLLGLTPEEADRLIVEDRKVQPRRVITSFKINNNVLREIDPDGTKAAVIDKCLGNSPQLYVGPRTQTDRAGKKPRRRQGR